MYFRTQALLIKLFKTTSQHVLVAMMHYINGNLLDDHYFSKVKGVQTSRESLKPADASLTISLLWFVHIEALKGSSERVTTAL